MTHVALRKGTSDAYKQAVLEGIYQAMRETCHIGDGDRFMSITEHDKSTFAYGETYLGIKRSDDLLQIQIAWSPGKNAQMKQALYKKIVDLLSKDPGVRPEDVFISVLEAPAENWSFGNGEAQFYRP